MKRIRDNHILLFIILCGGIALFPVINADFINLDDSHLIVNNPHIRSLSWEGIKKIFSIFYFSNYHPLTLLSFAVEYHFFGLNPRVVHLDNLLLHLLNVVFVYLVIKSIFKKNGLALLTAAIWMVHPMRVESVAWAIERKDVLYTLFYLGALLFYVKYVRALKQDKKQVFFYVVSLLLFVFAALSKAMAVSLSLAIVLIDVVRERKVDIKFFLDKAPFFLLSLLFGVLSLLGHAHAPAGKKLVIAHQLVYASKALFFYLQNFLFPFNLSLHYPYPDFQDGIPWYYWCYMLVPVAFIAGLVYALRRSPKLLFGLGFFGVNIFFVLQIWPTYIGLTADHYSYVPHIGLSFLAAAFLYYLYHKWNLQKKYLVAAGTGVFLFFSVLSFQRALLWESSLSLWTDVIDKYPQNDYGYLSRGRYRHETGDHDSAMHDFNKAIALNDKNEVSYQERGMLRLDMERFDKALNDFNTALRINPELGSAYLGKGNVFFQYGKYDKALTAFNNSIKYSPYAIQAYINRGNVHGSKGAFQKAREDFQYAIRLNPFRKMPYMYLGNIAVLEKNYEEAVRFYSQALKLDEAWKEVYYNRGSAYYALNNKNAACKDWKKAETLGYSPATARLRKNNCSKNQ